MGDGGSGLDGLARDLAAGEISRRTALRRFAGVALTAAVPSVLLSESALARCPRSRRCNGKCCPRNARCRRGKCKCKSGFTKCGKKCVDLQTDENHCGTCSTVCDPGETCIAGVCSECQVAGDCPPDGQCGVAACNSGQCTYAPNPQLGSACTGQGNEPGVVVCSQGSLVCQTQCSGKPNGTPCDDANLCTVNDVCTDGVCSGTPKVCQPGEVCEPSTGICTT